MYKTLDDALKNITHANPARRQDAAKSLAQLKGAQRVDALISLLHDTDEGVRDQAALSLVIVNDQKAIQPLIECFIDPERKARPNIDGKVSSDIPTGIKHFGAKAVPYLLPYLDDPLDALQKNILWLFAEIADPTTVEALVAVHENSDEGAVRYAIKEALKQINSGPARAFLGGLKKRW